MNTQASPGPRSGQLLATNDHCIEQLVDDPNYEITPEGRIYSLRTGERVEIGLEIKRGHGGRGS